MDAAYTGNTISRLRKELGLTQKELAEKLHVTDKAVSKWERGINFPDLGLLEHLAHHLGTTPAVLLGLEESGPDELLHSMAELSARQLEEARKSLGRIGWGCILTGAVLFLTYQWIPRQTVLAYQSLHILITVILFGGIWGLVGMVICVPLFAVIYDTIKRLVRRGLEKHGLPELWQQYKADFPDEEPRKIRPKKLKNKK